MRYLCKKRKFQGKSQCSYRFLKFNAQRITIVSIFRVITKFTCLFHTNKAYTFIETYKISYYTCHESQNKYITQDLVMNNIQLVIISNGHSISERLPVLHTNNQQFYKQHINGAKATCLAICWPSVHPSDGVRRMQVNQLFINWVFYTV